MNDIYTRLTFAAMRRASAAVGQAAAENGGIQRVAGTKRLW